MGHAVAAHVDRPQALNKCFPRIGLQKIRGIRLERQWRTVATVLVCYRGPHAVGDHGEEFEPVAAEPDAASVLSVCLTTALNEEGQPRLHPETGEMLKAVLMRSVRKRFVAKWEGSAVTKRQAFFRARRSLDDIDVFHIDGEEWAAEKALW